MSEIVVIGAGVVGAAVAYYAALAGADVTVVDAGRPGGGTSSATFAWLNANNKSPRAYFDLNVAGMREHLALKNALGRAPWLHEGGNLEWAEDEQGRSLLRARVERLRSWGYAAQWLSPEQVRSELEPDLYLDRAAVDQVAYFPEECWLDPLPLIHALLDRAERQGMRRHLGRVDEITIESGRVRGVVTEGGDRFAAAMVVVCAGRTADKVASLVDFSLPMANTPGLLAVTAPAATCLGRVVHAPHLNLRPDGAGRLLLHSDDTDGMVDAGTQPHAEHSGCRELLRRAQAVLPALAGGHVEAARIGVRPMPRDGHSAVGPVPGVEGIYLAVTHSGATLCLALGRMAASELLGGGPISQLAPFRPDRFRSVPRDDGPAQSLK